MKVLFSLSVWLLISQLAHGGPVESNSNSTPRQTLHELILPDSCSICFGSRGPAGPPGKDGCTGPQGVPGSQGNSGPPGQPGPAGSAGPAGATGPRGPAGPRGNNGLKGEAGNTGPAGPPGRPGTPAATNRVSCTNASSRGATTTCPTGYTVVSCACGMGCGSWDIPNDSTCHCQCRNIDWTSARCCKLA